ncbi:regulating synaptic membrane exocytosis protein 2-like [Perca flavescens]|uniref:regulating synaptic membrane exocytosis protein 2-like n=1 Tax=Perca flavescens TaxID=8167 RepID=UPI00106EB445|nr:regulating synaptic membrane exocytosis protein 2-like [Perca flavescens]
MDSQWRDHSSWPGESAPMSLQPVSWQPSKDGERLIGRIVLNKRMKDGTIPADSGALLGLKVVGGKMTESGRLCAFITKVKKGSLADTVGHLRPGDQVLEWNGRALQGASFNEVYNIILDSKAEPQVELLVCRPLGEVSRSADISQLESSSFDCQKVSPSPISPGVLSGPVSVSNRRPLVPRIQVKLWYDKVGQQLIVTVLGAKELPVRDDGRPRNPYVNIYLLPDRSDKSKRRTKTVKKSVEPRWNQTFMYSPVPQREFRDWMLELTVWDQARVREEENQFLGEVLVEMESALLDDQPHWYKLQLYDVSSMPSAPYLQRRGLQHNYDCEDGIGVISDFRRDFHSSTLSVPEQVISSNNSPRSDLVRMRSRSPSQPCAHSGNPLYPLYREGAHTAVAHTKTKLGEPSRRTDPDGSDGNAWLQPPRTAAAHPPAQSNAGENFGHACRSSTNCNCSSSHSTSTGPSPCQQTSPSSPCQSYTTSAYTNPGPASFWTHQLPTTPSPNPSCSTSPSSGTSPSPAPVPDPPPVQATPPAPVPAPPPVQAPPPAPPTVQAPPPAPVPVPPPVLAQAPAPVSAAAPVEVQAPPPAPVATPEPIVPPAPAPTPSQAPPPAPPVVQSLPASESTVPPTPAPTPTPAPAAAPTPAPAAPPQPPEQDRRPLTPGGTRKGVMKEPSKMVDSLSFKSTDSEVSDVSLLRISGAEPPEGQSEGLGAGSEGTQEAAVAAGGGATLLASESEAEESEPETEPVPAKPVPGAPGAKPPGAGEVCSLNRNNDDDDDDKKKRSGMAAMVLGMVGLGKKNQNTQVNPEEEEKKKKVIRLPVQRSVETGLAVEFKARFTRQPSRDPDADDPKPGALIFPGVKLTSDKQFTGFLDGLGPAQLAGRQTLATPPLGDIQIGMVYRKERLDVEVIRARGLVGKQGNKNTPAPYVKVYLMDNGKCVLKRRTRLARKSPDPLYQQQLQFEEHPEGK